MIDLWTFGDSHAGEWAGWNQIKIKNLNIKICSYPSTLMYSWAHFSSSEEEDRFDLVEIKKDDYVKITAESDV